MKRFLLRFLEQHGARLLMPAPVREAREEVVPILVEAASAVGHIILQTQPNTLSLRPERAVVHNNNIRYERLFPQSRFRSPG